MQIQARDTAAHTPIITYAIPTISPEIFFSHLRRRIIHHHRSLAVQYLDGGPPGRAGATGSVSRFTFPAGGFVSRAAIESENLPAPGGASHAPVPLAAYVTDMSAVFVTVTWESPLFGASRRRTMPSYYSISTLGLDFDGSRRISCRHFSQLRTLTLGHFKTCFMY